MHDVVTLGEAMLRLSAPPGWALENAAQFHVHVGGAEANVAITLARLGLRAGWISRLVDDPLGRRIAGAIRGQGVDISTVSWTTEGRTGLYFLEPGVPPRPGRVIYDRRGSAMAGLLPDEVDWAYVRNARCIHLTGITPALSETCLAVTARALREARDAGIPISFDVNYRASLWSPAQAAQALAGLLPGVSLLLCSARDASRVFDTPTDGEGAARELARLFRAPLVVLTLGEEGALAWQDGQILRQPAYRGAPLDPVGRGDAFAAGVLAGYLAGNLPMGLRFGAALAMVCQTYLGDVGWFPRADLELLDGLSDISR